MPTIGFGLERVGLFALKRPWTVVLLVLLACTISILGIPQIRTSGDLSNLFKSQVPSYQNFEAFSKRFPTSQEDILITVQGEGLLDREKLELLANTSLDIGFVEGISGVTSLFSIHTPPDKKGETTPLIPVELPEKPDDYKKMLDVVKGHPLIKGGLLAPDAEGGPVTMLVASLKRSEGAEGYGRAINEIKKIAEQELSPLGIKVQVAGVPAMQKEISDAIRYDRLTFTIGGFLFGTLINLFFFRKLNLILISSAGPLIAVLCTLGLIGWAGLNLNSFLNVIPALILVITFSDSLHMLFSIRKHLREGDDRFEASRKAILHVGPACVLTSLTTSIAMYSLVLANSEVIQHFGMAAAFGTLIAFLAVIVIIPALTVLMVRDEHSFVAKSETNEAFRTLDVICQRVERFVIPNYYVIAVAGLILVTLFSYFHLHLTPQYRMSDQVPDSKQSLQGTKMIDKHLAGVYPVYVMVNWRQDKKFNDPEVLDVIGKVHKLMGKNAKLHNVWSLESIKDWYFQTGKVTEKGMSEALKKLPEHIAKKLYAEKYRSAIISAQIKDLPSSEIKSLVDGLRDKVAILQESHPQYVLAVNGLTTVSSDRSLDMIGELKWSLLSAVVIVILLIGVAFRSFSAMLLSIVPNLFPIVAVGSYLYFTGQGLEYGSVMGLTVAFGLAVDDTIHFLNRFNLEVRKRNLMVEAVSETLIRIGPVLILSTLILIFGLSVTVLSSLPVTRLFGELNIATLLAALLCDLIILPAIILFAYQIGKFGHHLLGTNKGSINVQE